MVNKISKYKRNTEFNLQSSALLVIDMQKYFVHPESHAYIPTTKTIISGITEMIKAYSAKGLPVILTRHINSAQNAKLLAKWWNDLITEKDPLSELTDKLDTSEGIIIKKSQYDAFYKTELEDVLLKKNIKSLVICGVMTNLCCETTARSAFIRGFEVLFTIDGTATQNKEFHLATVLNLAYGFATPVLVKNITSNLLT